MILFGQLDPQVGCPTSLRTVRNYSPKEAA